MARRLFGRSRANTDGISHPTLFYTDALPRDDLQTLGTITEVNSHLVGNRSYRSKTNEGPSPVASPPFHDVGANSPAVGLTTHNQFNMHGLNHDGIGVALGSPSMVPPAAFGGDQRPPHDLATGDMELANKSPSSLQRQPSKWKKMANLFKAKPDNNKTKSPFYQMPLSDNPQFQFESSAVSDKVSFPSMGEEPQGFLPWNAANDQRVHRAESWPENPATFAEGHNTAQPPSTASSSLLQIQIPESQMERYSVMFSGILGEKKHPSLLDRRSRTLGKLAVMPEEPPSPDRPRPRRVATSPCLGKSPSFTLFPPTPNPKPGKTTTSTTSSTSADPLIKPRLRRAATAPPDSPMGPPSGQYKQFLTVDGPQSAMSPMSNSSADYSESSYMTPDERSPEPWAVRHGPVKSYVDESKEPQWEMLHRPTTPDSPRDSVDSTPATSPEEHPPMTPPKDFPPAPPGFGSLYGPAFPPRTDSRGHLPLSTPSLGSLSSREGEEQQPQAPPKDRQQPQIPSLRPTRERVDLLMDRRINAVTSGSASTSSMPTLQTPSGEDPSGPPVSNHSHAPPVLPPSPRAEISIARSVSITKRSKQKLLVPLGSRADQLTSNERLVERQPLTVNIVDVRKSHRPGRSQDIFIETI